MPNYKILTDSGCDLPKAMAESLELAVVPLTVNFRGQALDDSVDDTIRDIYDGLRQGEPASTSAVNPDRWEKAMEEILAQGQDVLTITFSSGLSTTYQSAVIAAAELQEQYPERKILVVDSLSASLGQGLLVWYAAAKRQAGMDINTLHAWLEENKLHLCHWFTVDDLMYLKRGGRVSAATALVGTMLQIKPVLHVDNEGHLINVSKVRGRKASLQTLAKKMAEVTQPGENDTIFISHGDCRQEAEELAAMLKRDMGVREVVIGYVGAVIGSHSGPGTIALFFLGQHR